MDMLDLRPLSFVRGGDWAVVGGGQWTVVKGGVVAGLRADTRTDRGWLGTWWQVGSVVGNSVSVAITGSMPNEFHVLLMGRFCG